MIEGESGRTTVFSAIEYPPAANNCEVFYPSMADYELALHIATKLRDIGRSQRAVDVLIASMCINRGFELVTKDSDYMHIKAVRPDFKLKLRQ